jgi:tRNA nucleotidyltransferase (CCA-adding enzyme)
VRDLILRAENYDIDLVVEGDGIQLGQTMAQEGQGKIRIHKKFGTATLIFPNNYRLDIATARLEYYDHPAALPRVEHSSIKLDLYRRDFTVNALALHLHPQHFGELIDFFGGQRDMKERAIRVLHNLSFVEDPTRVFRAVRFEQRFHFQIAKHTHQLMENAVRSGLFGRLSGRRLFRELALCLEEERPFQVIKQLGHYDLLRFFHLRFKPDRAMEMLFQRLEGVISWYNLLFTGEKNEKWVVPLLGLVDGLSEKETGDFLNRLTLPASFRTSFLQRRLAAHQVMQRLTYAPIQERSDLYRLLHPLPTNFLLYAMGRTESGEVKKAISLYFTELKRMKIALGGKDLKRMGFLPGPIYNEILQSVLRARLDGKIHSAAEEMEYVRQKYERAIAPARSPEEGIRA